MEREEIKETMELINKKIQEDSGDKPVNKLAKESMAEAVKSELGPVDGFQSEMEMVNPWTANCLFYVATVLQTMEHADDVPLAEWD